MRKHRIKFLAATLVVAIVDFFQTLIYHRRIIANMEAELMKPFALRLTGIKQRIAGEVDLGLESPLLRDFVGMLISAYKKQEGAYNYFSLFANDAEFGEPFEIVIQRKLGKTPSILAGELREENARLKRDIAALKSGQPISALNYHDFKEDYGVWAMALGWDYKSDSDKWEREGEMPKTHQELIELYYEWKYLAVTDTLKKEALKSESVMAEFMAFKEWAAENYWRWVSDKGLWQKEHWKSRTPVELFEFYKKETKK